MNQNTPGDRIKNLASIVGCEFSIYAAATVMPGATATHDIIILQREPGYRLGLRTCNFLITGSEGGIGQMDGAYEYAVYHYPSAWVGTIHTGQLPLNQGTSYLPQKQGVTGYYLMPVNTSMRAVAGQLISRPFIAGVGEDMRLNIRIINNGAGGGALRIHLWGEWFRIDSKDIDPAW